MLKITFVLALLIAFVYADVADYTKSAKRTFNVLEGKVPVVSVEMDPKDLEQLRKIAQVDQEHDIMIDCNFDASCLKDFETKVTMTVELDGEKQVFESVRFKTGGNYGRANDRIGYNLKLNGNDLFLNRKQIRLRPDANDSSYMRSKVAYDLLNNWGIPSIQESYCEFYLNGEYFGLYFLQDSLKPSWIKKTYGISEDKEVETLYYCRTDGVNLVKGDNCYNENENAANYTQPFEEFLDKIEKAKTIEDLEKFMNVDLLMKNLAIEFLFGSFDHFLIQGHNFYVYQREDGIWDMILVDFDAEFGSFLYGFSTLILQRPNVPQYGYRYKFEDMPKPGKILLDAAYFNDNSLFIKALRELMVTGFNPDNLFDRIDELEKFIIPYVKKTVTPREDGRLPGVINFKGSDYTRTYEDFIFDVESFEPNNPMTPTFRSWIINRFVFACEEYGFDKEEILKEAAEFRGKKYVPKEYPLFEEDPNAPPLDPSIIFGPGPEPNGPEPNGPEPNAPKPNGPEPNGPEPNAPKPNGPEPNGPPANVNGPIAPEPVSPEPIAPASDVKTLSNTTPKTEGIKEKKCKIKTIRKCKHKLL